jgi:hypothetical protein
MTNESEYFADLQGPSSAEFNVAIDDALLGRDESLIYILSLSRFTDGEGSLNFGTTLLRLRKSIGRDRFNTAFDALSENERISTRSDMNAAFEMQQFIKRANAG